MRVVETALFTRQVVDVLSDDDYRRLQQALVDRPELGALIPGGGGLRKVRWAAEGRGKRGGVRVIYYWAVSQVTLLMLFIYQKNMQADLSPRQMRGLRSIIAEEYP